MAGPSQSTQVSLVNGRLSQSRSFTYVLQPKAEGRASIGAVRAGDQTAPAIDIEVVAGSIRPRARPRGGIDPFADPFGGNPFGDPFEEMMGRPRGRSTPAKVLVEAQPSRTRLYVGEPLVLTYYLYTQVSVSDLQLKDAPQYAGFWAEDLERGQGAPVGRAGDPRRRELPPLPVPEEAALPDEGRPADAAAGHVPDRPRPPGLLRRRRVRRARDEAGDDHGAAASRRGRASPARSAGSRTSASVDRDVVPLGEAVTLRFRVAGTGNLKWVDRGPEVTLGGARVYPPQQKTELRTTEEGVSGSRTWEFVVVPQTTGELQIPALPFSYFDPQAGKIVSTATAPIAVRVEGGTLAAGLPAPPPTQAAAGRGAGSLPLRTELDRHAGIGARALRPHRCSRSPASRSCCTPGCGSSAAAARRTVPGAARIGLVALRPRRARRAGAGP